MHNFPANAPQSSLKVKAVGEERKLGKSGLRSQLKFVIPLFSRPAVFPFFPLQHPLFFFTPTLSDGQFWAVGREELARTSLRRRDEARNGEWDKSPESGRDARATKFPRHLARRHLAELPSRPC
jgi:hypothetical protein